MLHCLAITIDIDSREKQREGAHETASSSSSVCYVRMRSMSAARMSQALTAQLFADEVGVLNLAVCCAVAVVSFALGMLLPGSLACR